MHEGVPRGDVQSMRASRITCRKYRCPGELSMRAYHGQQFPGSNKHESVPRAGYQGQVPEVISMSQGQVPGSGKHEK